MSGTSRDAGSRWIGTVGPWRWTASRNRSGRWFETTFAAPTAAQEQGWPAIADGDHTLILAPTGSGKTLAAFLWGLDRLMYDPPPETARHPGALHLAAAGAGGRRREEPAGAAAGHRAWRRERLGQTVRDADGGHAHRRHAGRRAPQLVRNPPDVLITTPESLYLMLTSQARETLRNVETVIVDEIHALAATKRGAHLALTLERLEEQSRSGRPSASACRPPSARWTRSPASWAGQAGTAPPPAGDRRRRRGPQGPRDRGRRPGRGHGPPGRDHRRARRAARPPPGRCAAPSGRRCTPGCSS